MWMTDMGIIHKDNIKRNIWKSIVFILGINYIKEEMEIILHADEGVK